MLKAPLKKPMKAATRQFIDDPNRLLKAILKAVGSLKPGEGLEIRRVRDPQYKPPTKTKKQATKRRGSVVG